MHSRLNVVLYCRGSLLTRVCPATQGQYIFVHEALCDYTVSGDTSIDASSFKEAVERLRAPDGVRGISGFDFQFQVCQ